MTKRFVWSLPSRRVFSSLRGGSRIEADELFDDQAIRVVPSIEESVRSLKESDEDRKVSSLMTKRSVRADGFLPFNQGGCSAPDERRARFDDEAIRGVCRGFSIPLIKKVFTSLREGASCAL